MSSASVNLEPLGRAGDLILGRSLVKLTQRVGKVAPFWAQPRLVIKPLART